MKIELNKTDFPFFLNNISDEEGILLNNSFDEIKNFRDLDRFNLSHRTELVDAIKIDLGKWNAPNPSFDAANQLLKENCYAVMCGQQPGLFAGPLFTFYKIVGTLKLAEYFNKKFVDKVFVPVFWLEGDDHDFDEIAQLGYYDKNNKFVKSSVPDSQHKRYHVGERYLTNTELNQLLTELKSNLIETEYSDELLKNLEKFYSNNNLATGFAEFIYYVLGETNLIIASSRNPVFKRLASDVIKKEISSPEVFEKNLIQQTEILKNHNLPTPIKIISPQTFLTYENERKQLIYENAVYSIKGSDKIFQKNELENLAHESPELFSPKVTLRPIMQDAIFPTAIFLGGPTELAYLRQLRGGYNIFNIAKPIIAPRPFGLILEPKQIKLLTQLNLTLEDLFDKLESKYKAILNDEEQIKFDSLHKDITQEVDNSLTKFYDTASKIDVTLLPTLNATKSKIDKEISHFAGKIQNALKRRNINFIDKYNSLKEFIFPSGVPQERAINSIYFINKFGVEKFRKTLLSLEIENGYIHVLNLNDYA